MLFRDPASLFPNFSLDNLSKFPTAQIQEFVHWARAPFGLPLDGSRFVALFVPHDLKNARRAVVNTRVLTNQLVQVQRKRSGGGQLSQCCSPCFVRHKGHARRYGAWCRRSVQHASVPQNTPRLTLLLLLWLHFSLSSKHKWMEKGFPLVYSIINCCITIMILKWGGIKKH